MSETEVSTEVQFEATDDLDAFSKGFFGQESEPASSEAEQEPTAEASEDVTEAQTTDPELDDVIEETPPVKKTVQDRINELVRQREDAKRDAKAELDNLRKEFEEKLNALRPPTERKSAEPQPTDQNTDGSDKYPLGEFDPTYIRDLTRFTLEQERTQAKIRDEEERKTREVQTQQQALAQAWNEKLAPAKERYPDLDVKGQALINNFANLEQGYAQYLTNLIMSMDQGPDVLYYLASNPDEAVKIVNSGAQRATLTLGRIEAKFIDAEAQKTLAKPKVSKAPEPPQVQTRGTGGGGRVSVEGDTDNLDAFSKEFFRKKG